MDVCFASDLWGRQKPSGVGIYVERIAQYVPAAAPEISFTGLGFQEPHAPPVPPGPNLRYAQIPGNTKLSWLRWWRRGATADVARHVGPVAVTHALHPLPVPTTKSPWISTVHDISPVMFPEQYARGARFKFTESMKAVVGKGAHVIAISRTTADDLRRIYDLPESRISVVRYGIDAQRVEVDDERRADLTARYGLPPRFLLFVGDLNRRKNLVTLVRAFASVADQIPDVDVVLAGSEGLGVDEVRAAIAGERIGDRVHLPGYANHGDALALMAMSEAFVFPTLYEGFGLPPLEAMVQGTPVVAAAGGSVPEIVGDAALISEPPDVEALAANIVRVVTEPALRDDLVVRGHARAAEFDWTKMAKEIVAVYEQVAGSA